MIACKPTKQFALFHWSTQHGRTILFLCQKKLFPNWFHRKGRLQKFFYTKSFNTNVCLHKNSRFMVAQECHTLFSTYSKCGNFTRAFLLRWILDRFKFRLVALPRKWQLMKNFPQNNDYYYVSHGPLTWQIERSEAGQRPPVWNGSPWRHWPYLKIYWYMSFPSGHVFLSQLGDIW